MKRLQFDFTPGAIERIDAMQARLKAKDRAEVLRRALALLDKCLTADSVTIKQDGVERSIVLI